MNGNGLIKIVSNRSDDLYIPINSIQHVQQGRAAEIIIKTNIDFESDTSVRPPLFKVLSYTLTELNSTQTTKNINSIITAWESVLSGQETTSVVGFVVPIDTWTRTVNEWIL